MKDHIINKKKFTKIASGFTLMELMIVVIIVTSIAIYSLPKFQKAVERDHRRNAHEQLRALHSAEQMYWAYKHDCNGDGLATESCYWPSPVWAAGTGLTEINSNLNINLSTSGGTFTFNCAITGNNDTFSCTATRTGGIYILTVTEAPLNNIPAEGALNPSCANGTGTCP